jgi:hypothetical protein
MSTNSSITMKMSEDNYKTIYCHWDGYLEGVGRTLFDHYQDKEKVEELINNGDISSLEKSPYTTEGHTFDKPVNGYTVFYGRDRGETDVEAINCVSLIDVMSRNKQEFNYYYDGNKWFLINDDKSITSLAKIFYVNYLEGNEI